MRELSRLGGTGRPKGLHYGMPGAAPAVVQGFRPAVAVCAILVQTVSKRTKGSSLTRSFWSDYNPALAIEESDRAT